MTRSGRPASVIAPLRTGLAGAASGAVAGLLVAVLVGVSSIFNEPGGVTTIGDGVGRILLALLWFGPITVVVLGLTDAGVALLVRGVILLMRRAWLRRSFLAIFGFMSAVVTFSAAYSLGMRNVEQYVGTAIVVVAQVAIFASTTRAQRDGGLIQSSDGAIATDMVH